jgi:hypothetical protein
VTVTAIAGGLVGLLVLHFAVLAAFRWMEDAPKRRARRALRESMLACPLLGLEDMIAASQVPCTARKNDPADFRRCVLPAGHRGACVPELRPAR